MNKVVKAGLVSSSWNKTPDQGHGHQLDRVVRRAPRESQAHHHLGRPDEVRRDGDHAQRLQLGQRQVEPDGGLRRPDRARQVADAGRRPTVASCCTNAVAQPTSASAALQTFLAGQGDVLFDYEDDALYAKRQGEAGHRRHAAADDPDPEPDRRDQDAPARPPRRSWPTCSPRPARQVWGQQGYRPVLPVGGGHVQLPQAEGPVHHRHVSAAGPRSTRSSSTRTTGIVAQDRAGARGLHGQRLAHG